MLQDLKKLSSNDIEDIQILAKIAEFLVVHCKLSDKEADQTLTDLIDAGDGCFDELLKETVEAFGLSYDDLLHFLVGQSTEAQLLSTPLTDDKIENLQDFI